jgi:hypothetical protein
VVLESIDARHANFGSVLVPRVPERLMLQPYNLFLDGRRRDDIVPNVLTSQRQGHLRHKLLPVRDGTRCSVHLSESLNPRARFSRPRGHHRHYVEDVRLVPRRENAVLYLGLEVAKHLHEARGGLADSLLYIRYPALVGFPLVGVDTVAYLTFD